MPAPEIIKEHLEKKLENLVLGEPLILVRKLSPR
jgi:hypothetical protein